MMFLLQPYYDHDRGVLDHVLTRVSRGWHRFGRCPEPPDLRTGMTAGARYSRAWARLYKRSCLSCPHRAPDELSRGDAGPSTGPFAPWMARSSPMDGFTACPGLGPASPALGRSDAQRISRPTPKNKKSARSRGSRARGGIGGGERIRRSRSCGGTRLLTSGSATSRSRSGGPGCPAAARSPAGGPGRRRSCRPSGRTPGWPCRWQRSSASCAPG